MSADASGCASTLDVRPGLSLRPIAVDDAEALFASIDAHRTYLREWLPWLDWTRCVEDERAFLATTVARGAAGLGTVYVILLDGHACGIAGFNWVEPTNRICEIGYWLAADCQGRGIVTACVARLMRHSFDDLGLNRVTIPVAIGNARSRAVCERLGLRNEGVLREAEWLYDHFVDHVMYARVRRDVTPSAP